MDPVFSSLFSTQALPSLLSPGEGADSDVPGLFEFSEWLSASREQIDAQLNIAGVLLIRGYPVYTAHSFREICNAICPTLRNYTGGDSPRSGIVDKVYSSTEYSAELEILLHNELSYAGWSPDRVFFGCLQPSETGGETHLADGRQLYRMLDDEVRARFEERGVTYLQHLWDADGAPGIGKSWQETFETTEQKQAEKYLEESGMTFEWTDLGLRTAATKPGVRVHPANGEKCWHNQADQWHRDLVSVKDSVGMDSGADGKTKAGEESLGNHVVYGDGSEIEVADLEHIRAVSREVEVAFSWQRGDVMVIDNVLSMHGRKPFSGKRRVVVAMA
jgi:alpha-ketoglutarate-dependent taurine dioxygenase